MFQFCESWKIRLSTKKLVLSNCGAGEDSLESLGLQGDQTSQSWILIKSTDAEAEPPILWPPGAISWLIGKDPDAEKIEAGEEGNRVRWLDDIINSVDMSLGKLERWWMTGRPAVLQSMVSQNTGRDLVTEQLEWYCFYSVSVNRARKYLKKSSKF